MRDFDEDPLDLFDDDGDGVIEMCTLFNDEKSSGGGGQRPSGNSGCCIVLMAMGAAALMAGWGLTNFIC